MFVAKGSDTGEDRPKDGLTEREVNYLFPGTSEGTHATTVGGPVESQTALLAHFQKIVDQTNDTPIGIFEDTVERFGELRCGTHRSSTDRISFHKVDQTARNFSKPAPLVELDDPLG